MAGGHLYGRTMSADELPTYRRRRNLRTGSRAEPNHQDHSRLGENYHRALEFVWSPIHYIHPSTKQDLGKTNAVCTGFEESSVEG